MKMARSPAINGLIVVVVVALVGGVAWFKSQRETETAPIEPSAVATERTTAPLTPPREPERTPPKDTVEPAPAELEKPDVLPPAKEDPPTAVQRDTEPVTPPDSPATPPARDDESRSDAQPTTETTAAPATLAPDDTPTSQPLTAKLPRVIDLGADKCKACKELAPILVELKKEYAGRAIVEFVDVWKNPKAADPYKIRVIPTQIFFDRDGKEVWRHEGFLAKKEFVAKLAELGAK
jgi:thioredoxin 1